MQLKKLIAALIDYEVDNGNLEVMVEVSQPGQFPVANHDTVAIDDGVIWINLDEG